MVKLTSRDLNEIIQSVGNYDVLISTMKLEDFTLNEKVRSYDYFNDYSDDELQDTDVMYHVLNDIYELAIKSDDCFILVDIE